MTVLYVVYVFSKVGYAEFPELSDKTIQLKSKGLDPVISCVITQHLTNH